MRAAGALEAPPVTVRGRRGRHVACRDVWRRGLHLRLAPVSDRGPYQHLEWSGVEVSNDIQGHHGSPLRFDSL